MSTAPIEPYRLVTHALALVTGQAVPASPADAHLRRAVSAAYYAVFHALALAVARRLAPASAAEDRFRLARSVEHGKTKDVCGWLSERGGGRREVVPIVERLRGDPRLVELSRLFVTLHGERQRADYDHLSAVTEAEAQASCVDADRALTLLAELEGTPELDELLALVALHTALR